MTINWTPKITDGPGTIADKIVKSLQADIDSGRLSCATRLPSQRELSYALNIAVGTVTRAYQTAESKGLIFSDGRRGTFVGSASDSSGLSELIRGRGAVINLGECMPTRSIDPDLGRVLKVIGRRANSNEWLRYGPETGNERHRRAGAAWFRKLGITVDPSAVQLVCGAQHAMSILLPLIARPKDAIAVEAVTYPGIKTLSEIHGFDLVGIEYDDEGMLPDALERALKKRRIKAIYVMPTLHNPTGAVMGLQRRQRLAELAESHDFLIIEDDIHRLLVDTPPPSFAHITPNRTCCMASISKIVAGGLRVAFLLVPDNLRARVQMAIQASIFATPQILFEIFATWLEDGTVDATLSARRKQARQRQRLARRIFGTYRIPYQESCPYVWLEPPGDWSAQELALYALQQGVSINAPDPFVVRPFEKPNRVRICLCAPETTSQLEIGLTTLVELIKSTPHVRGASM